VRTLLEAIGLGLGDEVVASSSVHGGDTATALRVDLASGRRVFAKTHPDPPSGFFTTEAAGLTWLRSASELPIPEVLAVSDGDGEQPAFLVLSWIERGAAIETTEAQFGRSLARLHSATPACFGREDRRTTGSRGVPNEPCDTWAEFYATQRLAPLARMARDELALSAEALAGLDRLDADRLTEIGGPAEPPARLHGDLWAGNRVVDAAGVSWLIDPAAHGGHREFDLAMMRLFGGFGPTCFATYQEVAPLADGWPERIELHQLAPLVVHAIKFGGS
jgi:fructosamine-3-kinase